MKIAFDVNFWVLRFVGMPTSSVVSVHLCNKEKPYFETQPSSKDRLSAHYMIKNGIFIKARHQFLIGKYAVLKEHEVAELLKLGISKEYLYRNEAMAAVSSRGTAGQLEQFTVVSVVCCECGTKNPVGQGHSHWCRDFRQEF